MLFFLVTSPPPELLCLFIFKYWNNMACILQECKQPHYHVYHKQFAKPYSVCVWSVFGVGISHHLAGDVCIDTALFCLKINKFSYSYSSQWNLKDGTLKTLLVYLEKICKERLRQMDTHQDKSLYGLYRWKILAYS